MGDEWLSKRKSRIINWFKNPYNLLFVGILVLAFTIRLYVFFITKNQVLWWDEAGYFSQAKAYVANIPSGKMPGTEIIVPIFWAMLYKINPTEILARFGQLIISFLLVVVTYFAGERLFDKQTGLIAGFFIACNGVALFFTGRLLIYSWPPLIITAILLFFYKGYVLNQGKKYTYLSIFLTSFGIILYSTCFLAIPIIILFLLFTEKLKFLKNKELWKMGIIGFLPLIIYFIFSQINYGYIHPRFAVAEGVLSNISPDWGNIFAYFNMAPHMFGWLWIILFLIGLIGFLKLFLIFDLIIKGKSNKKDNAELFVLIWFLIVAGFYTSYLTFSRAYDAFLLPLFPVFGIICARGSLRIKKMLPKSNKFFVFLLILFVLIAGAYQINYGNKLIKAKVDSFTQVKEAGIWIKTHSNLEDIVISQSVPQNIYYSERMTYPPPSTQEEFESMIHLFKDII